MAKSVKDVLAMGKNVKMVDLRFIDLPGTWQHFSIPASTMDESLFEELKKHLHERAEQEPRKVA